jgi:hypothetical protein
MITEPSAILSDGFADLGWSEAGRMRALDAFPITGCGGPTDMSAGNTSECVREEA